MKWLRSTSKNTYTVAGRIIPAFNCAPLVVTDSVYDEIRKQLVIQSLIRNGCILVMDSYQSPEEILNSSNTLTTLKAENSTLKSDLEAVKAERDRLLDEAGKSADTSDLQKQLDESKAEVADLKKQLKEQKKLYKELKEEAEAKIAELTKE